MISAWELYLWTRLDIFSGMINLIPILGGLIAAFVYSCAVMGDRDCLPYRKGARNITICCCVWFVLTALIPTKKEFAMIWIVPQLATVENAELLKGEAAEIYKLAKQALTESLDINETQEESK